MTNTASRMWAPHRLRTSWWRGVQEQAGLRELDGRSEDGLRMRKIATRLVLLVACAMFASASRGAESNYAVKSPDGRIEVRIRATDRIKYDVLLNGKPLLQDS